MVSVFKQLARQYKNVRADLKVAVHYSEDEKVLKDKKALLDSIIAYLNSYEWLSRDGSIEKVRTYLKSGFDYDFVCKSFGISYESAKNTMKWANIQFKKKIGSETLRLIEEGKLEEAMCAFYVASGRIDLDNLLVDEYKPYLPQAEYLPYSLEECTTELKVLGAVSKARFKRFSEIVDEKKMAYLIHLLTGESRMAYLLRPTMVGLLTGEVKPSEAAQLEKDIKLENNII